ncbi:hypothetical protein [Halomicrobium salinisoli]|uniref:hypothetical protein n=1 Tax=Halomicrobium salinisoli TaxID=2878391 RepID=UPI001CF072E7|nr:hypothetical protein [Halomicrobium salinisoli]
MPRWPLHRARDRRTRSTAPDGPGGTPGDERRRSDDDRPERRQSASDGPDVTRRTSLRAAAGVLAVGGTGAAWRSRSGDAAVRSAEAPTDGREDFLWLGSRQWRAERLRETLLAFAARNGLSAFFGSPPGGEGDAGERLQPALDAAAAFGVDPWVNAGILRDATAEAFLDDAEARERHLARLRGVTERVDAVDGGRLVLWQEAPVMGNWAAGEKWGAESAASMLEHGPAVFERQRAAVAAVSDVDVGIFPHFPYVVDSKRPRVFAELAAALRDRGAAPDFGMTDFYGGWYEKDVGPGPADAAVRSLIENAREHLDRAVFYMGQAHTINPGHTPSAQSIRSTLRAARAAGAAGVGWYTSGNYDATERGFDPLVPNPADAAFDGGPRATPVTSRDRHQYAWAATLAAQAGAAPADRFDCWLHGDGFAFHDHRVEARTDAGEWVLLGDVGGYLDGDHPYANGRTAALRALPRERFAADGRLDLRIETRAGGDSTRLAAVVALPWDPAAFVTERAATALLDGDRDLGPFLLGRTDPGVDLRPGERRRLSVPVGDRTPSLTPLVHPDHADAVDRLAAAEERPDFDPDARFDLWLAGSELGDSAAAPPLVDADGDPVPPVDAAIVAVAAPDAALYYGLARDRFLDGGLSLGTGGDSAARVDRAAAMPAAGSACFRSPDEAAALLAEQPDEVATYALDWLDGA